MDSAWIASYTDTVLITYVMLILPAQWILLLVLIMYVTVDSAAIAGTAGTHVCK